MLKMDKESQMNCADLRIWMMEDSNIELAKC